MTTRLRAVARELATTGTMKPAEYKALRRRLGLTQAELADALGVAAQTVSNRERGLKKSPIDREAEFAIRYLGDHPEAIRPAPVRRSSVSQGDEKLMRNPAQDSDGPSL